MISEDDRPYTDSFGDEGEDPTEDSSARMSYVEANFLRCSSCRHATELMVNEGRLRCLHYDMLINAEADEIPDDCPHYEKAE